MEVWDGLCLDLQFLVWLLFGFLFVVVRFFGCCWHVFRLGDGDLVGESKWYVSVVRATQCIGWGRASLDGLQAWVCAHVWVCGHVHVTLDGRPHTCGFVSTRISLWVGVCMRVCGRVCTGICACVGQHVWVHENVVEPIGGT